MKNYVVLFGNINCLLSILGLLYTITDGDKFTKDN